MTKTALMPVTLNDKEKAIGIKNYADMVAFDDDRNLAAIRFGGYPETVQAMSDSVFGDCRLNILLPGEKTETVIKTKGARNYIRKLTHGTVYAEGFLFVKDDNRALLPENASEEENNQAPRNLYIFCRNENELYAELDRKLSVPLIPEFSDYFIGELKKRRILKNLHIHSVNQEFKGWHMQISGDEHELSEILTEGLKSGKISVPGTNRNDGKYFEGIESFTDYLGRFGNEIAEKIQKSFVPRFNPENEQISAALETVNNHVIEHTGYSLYQAQLAAAEALKRRLESDRSAMLVAGCGTGKTKIATAALYAYQHRNGEKKAFNVIVCPSHVARKWVRELYETVPDCIAQVVSSVSDVDKLCDIYHSNDKTVYCVLSKETARNGYFKQPGVVLSKRKKGFLCPRCGEVQEMSVFDGENSFLVNADSLFFRNENNKNHKCRHCGEVLWSAVNPELHNPDKTQWVRIGTYGYVHRAFAGEHLRTKLPEEIFEQIERIEREPNGIYPAAGACRRYPLAGYIKHKLRKIDALLVDELHEYSGESAQGEAMSGLSGIAKKVIGMTATLVNGYAKGIFYLLFRLKPALMQADGFCYEDARTFCQLYGVVENVYETTDEQYGAITKTKARKRREKFLPGVSPVVYSKFLMENTVFLSLYDMGKELPDYEEIPVPCELSDEIQTEYSQMERTFKSFMQRDRRNANRILSTYLNLLIAYPDQPYGHPPVTVPEYEESLLIPKDFFPGENTFPKDSAVLDIIRNAVSNGERVILYTAWTRLDTQQRMKETISKLGYRVSVLKQNVRAIDREEWVRKKVEQGIDVLITNPKIVETGLDLNEFTTLIFYNMAFNLYVFRQASLRSWRINQTAPKVSVYMFYYKNTMQQRALRLMASKLAAATMIEGNLSEEGLAAMSDCKDMTSQLARELMNGIKENVGELSDTFKRMSIHNERRQKTNEDATVSAPAALPPIHIITPARPVNKREEETGQLSLFDLLAS